MQLKPASPFLDRAILGLKDAIVPQFSDMVCSTGLPYIASGLQDCMLNPTTLHPIFLDGATPLDKLKRFRTLVNVVYSVSSLFGVKVAASSLAGTTLHVDMAFSGDLHLKLGEFAELERALDRLGAALRVIELENTADFLKQLLWIAKEGWMVWDVSHFFNTSFEVVFHDLQCTEEGLDCTVLRVGDIRVQNIGPENLGEWDKIITNIVSSFVSSLLDKALDEYLQSDSTTGPRFGVPVLLEGAVKQLPPILYAVLFGGRGCRSSSGNCPFEGLSVPPRGDCNNQQWPCDSAEPCTGGGFVFDTASNSDNDWLYLVYSDHNCLRPGFRQSTLHELCIV
ncbi:hypothetical protein TraAM80_08403 [Trypanosoma rangeli]|uniref:Uncharacterized protein n=1 Tax=Trypanosoma rangeli TaxID=5698 RepID=A0A3R7K1U5_TRYRA|nr:uncharacterized protein TraAM80_08403 [Trypanosoma rangeli]RNE99079.1 hypothetical protein TraAM80_08403 [Trypanosoma rangeli]|eukprot:RNE99079.1 hypothetical protein TraAM80_08403 [Trypanosoma rangeli]